MNPDGLKKVTYWMSQGINLKQLAMRMRVNVATVYKWESKFPEFKEAINGGIDVESGTEYIEHNGEVVRLRHCKQCGKPFIPLSHTIDAYGFHVAGEEFCCKM